MRRDVKRSGQAGCRGSVVDVRNEQVGRDCVRDGLVMVKVMVVSRMLQRQMRVQWVLRGAQANCKRATHFTTTCSRSVGPVVG